MVAQGVLVDWLHAGMLRADHVLQCGYALLRRFEIGFELFRFGVPRAEALDQRRHPVLPVLDFPIEFLDPGILRCLTVPVVLQLIALGDDDFQVAADVLDLPLQLVAARERVLERVRQLAGAHLCILVGSLILVVLFHQAFVLLEQALVLIALCLQLLLPAGVDRRFLALGAAAANQPSQHDADQHGDKQCCDVNDGYFRHAASSPILYKTAGKRWYLDAQYGALTTARSRMRKFYSNNIHLSQPESCKL